MRNLIVLKDEFIKEIEVVKEERRWRTEDKPQSFTYEVAMSTVFQTGPYGHPIVGWMNDLNDLTVDDLREWYQQWYAPNNATLVVSGDVKAEDVHDVISDYQRLIETLDLSDDLADAIFYRTGAAILSHAGIQCSSS